MIGWKAGLKRRGFQFVAVVLRRTNEMPFSQIDPVSASVITIRHFEDGWRM
jgi:hypothetical protein